MGENTFATKIQPKDGWPVIINKEIMEIKKKTVLITGGSSGIGKATAIQLSRAGAKVILAARSEGPLREVRDEIHQMTNEYPLILSCDIAREEEVLTMADTVREKYGQLDVLINNAGFCKYLDSEKITNEIMRRHFEVNFFGTYYCTQALLPLMKLQGSGYILNIGSLYGKIVPFSDVSVYAASKFALRGYSDGLRKELKTLGIGVGLLMPGPVNTPWQGRKEPDERQTPAFLMVEPDRIAQVIEKMIRHNKKEVSFPRWMHPLLQAMSSF